MPTISLRLTDHEHAQLKEWAYGAHRSMQREAVFRIFSNHLESSGAVEEPKPVNPTRPPGTDAAPDTHFKPDFK